MTVLSDSVAGPPPPPPADDSSSQDHLSVNLSPRGLPEGGEKDEEEGRSIKEEEGEKDSRGGERIIHKEGGKARGSTHCSHHTHPPPLPHTLSMLHYTSLH